MATTRVPAWKRLGLKLKYAKDDGEVNGTREVGSASSGDQSGEPPRNVGSNGIVAEESREKHHSESSLEPKRSKKRKRNDDAVVESQASSHLIDTTTRTNSLAKDSKTKTSQGSDYEEKVNGHRLNGAASGVIERGWGGAHSSSRTENYPAERTESSRASQLTKRRKSVTFTTDTKADDGSSSQRLYDQWALEHPEAAFDFPIPSYSPPTNTISTVKSESGATKQAKKLKKKKKSKKKKTPKAQRQQPATDADGIPFYIHYLTLYATDRASWKFNKNQQSALLNHCLDPVTVPADLEPALVDYIHGLHGGMARARLQAAAEVIIISDDSDSGSASENDGDTRPLLTPASSVTQASQSTAPTTPSQLTAPTTPRKLPTPPSESRPKKKPRHAVPATDKDAARATRLAAARMRIRDQERATEQKSEAWRDKFLMRLRAERVLRALEESAGQQKQESPVPRVALPDGMPADFPARKRMRWGKIRTGVPDDDDEDEDDDDESSSEEEGDGDSVSNGSSSESSQKESGSESEDQTSSHGDVSSEGETGADSEESSDGVAESSDED